MSSEGKKARKCGKCGQEGHDKRKCPKQDTESETPSIEEEPLLYAILGNIVINENSTHIHGPTFATTPGAVITQLNKLGNRIRKQFYELMDSQSEHVPKEMKFPTRDAIAANTLIVYETLKTFVPETKEHFSVNIIIRKLPISKVCTIEAEDDIFHPEELE